MARLGELEQKVMARLWDHMGDELTVRNVAESFPDLAYTTVLTVLDRLERKGMVTRIKDGRAHRYVAAGSREAYTSALMREALGSAKDPGAVLVRFAETVSPEEAAVLRKALGSVARKATSQTNGAQSGNATSDIRTRRGAG